MYVLFSLGCTTIIIHNGDETKVDQYLGVAVVNIGNDDGTLLIESTSFGLAKLASYVGFGYIKELYFRTDKDHGLVVFNPASNEVFEYDKSLCVDKDTQDGFK
ncbi:hypothetical protein [Enterovibrio nigricans]|nr:hypothetical protein [Enterovibrio nigricans]